MRLTRQITLLIAAVLTFYNGACQKLWYPLGTAGFSTGVVQYTSLAIDNNGTKYVAYTDGANNDKATVMKYDGINWMTVGSAGFSSGTAYATSIAVDNNGTPYVAFQDQGNNYKATVMKYSGTGWVAVGGAGFSAGAVHETKIILDKSGTPYVAFRDSANSAKATVMKFNGTNWINVGNGGFTFGSVSQLSFAIDNNGTPYIAYTDLSANNAGYVMKFNGSNWVVVHYYANASFSNSDISLANIIIGKNDTPYIAYYYPMITQPYVKKFDGRWTWVGIPGFAPNVVSLAMDSAGIPYVVIKDTAKGGKMSVMKYDGANWVIVGNPGFSSDTFDFASMAFDKNNVPIIAYKDGANGNRATVMAYDCPPEANVHICAAVTDSLANRYITIIWDSSTVANFADSYRIYRENNGSYTGIGSVPVTHNSFTDNTINPSLQSFKYKLTYLNKCGWEMPLDSSIAHRSIWLAFNYLGNGFASVTWNRYEGILNLTYTLMRSNNGNPFIPVANFSIAGNDTTYLDVNPPFGENRYRIDVGLNNPCKAENIYYNKITSNTVTSWKTDIGAIEDVRNIVLMPNPAHNDLRIRATENLVKIEVFGLTGQNVITVRGNGKRESILDVSDLPTGTYLLRVNDIHKSSFIKQ